MTEARRHAETFVPALRGAGIATSRFTGLELVNEALTDTYAGKVTWDPAQCSLLEHVRAQVKFQVFRALRRTNRFRHLSIDAPANDPQSRADPRWRDDFERATAGSQGDVRPFMLAALVERVVPALRALAKRHRAAGAILDCWEQGISDRAEVIARTGLTPAAYHAARARLLYLAPRLPPELADLARDKLT